MIKPLLRIIPTYSGNVKLSCRISEYINKGTKVSSGNLKTDIYDAIVRGAVLDSASESLSKKKIQCNLLGSTYDYDLKNFYTYYKDTFWSSGYDYNTEDLEIIDRKSSTQSQTNTDLQMGCKRLKYSQEKYQYEFFAPIYIDTLKDLPDCFIINVKFVSNTISVAKEIRVRLDYSTSNYLHEYLYKYLQKVESEVCTMKSDTNTVSYKGIDLIRGGLVNVEDSVASSLYTMQHTSADFDCIIANGYERNNMCMMQIIPLSFAFNLSNILSDKEKILLKNTSFVVSGHYENDNNELPWNDFMTDYRNLSLEVKKMDSTSGLCEWTSGTIDNLMEYDFPSIDEKNLIDCEFSSKVTRMYSRWKMQQSDDMHPYIINTKYSFNKNQNSPYMYGQFPEKFATLQGIATLKSDKNSYDYSLEFPIGTENEYSAPFDYVIDEYKKSIESYQFDWFSIVSDTSDFASWKDNIDWSDVINDKSYYKGILYVLSNIYNKIDINKKEKLDKFAVVLVPRISTIDATTQANIKSTQLMLQFEDVDIADKNAYANNNLLTDVLISDDVKLHSAWVFSGEGSEVGAANSVVDNGIMYEKGYSDDMSYWTATGTDQRGNSYTYAILTDNDAKYVDLNEIGIDIDDINEYYEGSAVLSAFSSLKNSLYKMNSEKVQETFAYIDTNYSTFRTSLSILYSNIDLLNVDEDNTTYIKGGFEMLPLHVPASFTDSYAKIPLSPSATYFANTYILEEYCAYDEYRLPIEGTRKYVMDGGMITLKKCSYSEDPDSDHSAYKYEKKNEDNTYTFHTWSKFKSELWIDPIFGLAYGSSSSNYSKTSLAYIDRTHPELSYLQVTNPYEITTSYSSTIYKIGSFVKKNTIEMMQDTDVSRLVLTYIAGSSLYNIENMNNEESNEKRLYTTTYYLLDYIYKNVKKEVESAPKYKYLPVVYGNSKVYAKDLYVKKNNQKFYGNTIRWQDRDNDNDVIWVHTYNLRAVLAKYGIDDSILGDSRTFKTKFLSQDHLYWWYTELARDEDRNYPVDFHKRWAQFLWLRKKSLVYDKTGLNVKNVMIPLTSIKNEEGKQAYTSFKEFFKDIDYSYSEQTWSLKSMGRLGEFEMVFDCEMVRMNKDLHKLLRLDNNENTFRDLYLYRIETDGEWDTKYGTSDTYKVNYVNANDDTLSDYGLDTQIVMLPMFNDIWAQDKEDTMIYVYYKLQNLYEVNVTGLKKEESWWRYNSYDIEWMYNVISSQLQYLSEPLTDNILNGYAKSRFEEAMDRLGKGTKGKNQLNRYLYKKYQSNNLITDSTEENEDDLGYGIKMFCTKKEDGINYGYYKIVYEYDNTTNSIRMIGKINESDEHTSEKKWNYVTNMKYIKYVNGVDIVANPDYLANMITRMLPFMRVNPMTAMNDMDCLANISTISVNCTDTTSLSCNPIKEEYIDDEDKPKEKNLIKSPNAYVQKLKRYFTDIIPIMLPSNSVTEWYKKFKINEEKILDTGKYLSVGDSCIYEDTTSIHSFHPYRIYKKSESEEVKKSYNNYDYTLSHTPLEHKSYNASTLTLTDTYLYYIYPKYVKEEVLKILEDEEHTLEVFKQLLCTNRKFTEDEVLFLYNHYKVTYDSVPIKLMIDNSSKLWKLIYKFALK